MIVSCSQYFFHKNIAVSSAYVIIELNRQSQIMQQYKMINRWTFDNDDLFELVRIGRKRGTCCRYSGTEQMTKVGEIQEIYNSRGEIITVQITAVRKCRFCDIDDTWAHTEGEGDLSLEYWRKVHIEFFNKYYPDFQETDWLELNEFMVI